NGINTLIGGTPTNDTRNRYGLYDMCGNVSEWINDTALEYPWSTTYRGTRGGRWSNSDPKWVTNSV
ncbi:MAG TPA: SUMF1/EgtB/PvdO family nonheme iron enzyme, partial [Sedimentisphaerales bacterium]|nr:SUMF1/EgtB/PvdO family nonheme iron enzyme [Sedimentisphaerales bacterium]